MAEVIFPWRRWDEERWSALASRRTIELAPPKIDLDRVVFRSMLLDGEESVSGVERVRRLQEAGAIGLGYGHLRYLFTIRDRLPEAWRLSADGHARHICFDAFPVERGLDDKLFVPVLGFDGEWRVGNLPQDGPMFANDEVALYVP